jgi:response regulator RpfG family c-di-GMP phosphodiesterase
MNKIKNAATIPILVLTAKEGMAEIFKVEGVKEYLTKPLQPELLLTHIKKYV